MRNPYHIDRNLNLVIECELLDGSQSFVHHTPITEIDFSRNILLLSQLSARLKSAFKHLDALEKELFCMTAAYSAYDKLFGVRNQATDDNARFIGDMLNLVRQHGGRGDADRLSGFLDVTSQTEEAKDFLILLRGKTSVIDHATDWNIANAQGMCISEPEYERVMSIILFFTLSCWLSSHHSAMAGVIASYQSEDEDVSVIMNLLRHGHGITFSLLDFTEWQNSLAMRE